jgi:hypothetical protein
MQQLFIGTQFEGVGTYSTMNIGQTKRLYRLIWGVGIIAFLIFGYRVVKERWDDSLGSSLRDEYRSSVRDHEILTDREHDRILAEKGAVAAEEFRQSFHPDSRLRRAWQFLSIYENWGWALTLGSMILVSAILYLAVWHVGCRCFHYVRDGTLPQTSDLASETEETNKS